MGQAEITLRQLEAFVAVAETGGYRAAGRRLGWRQDAVSKAIAALEKELGAELVQPVRGGRPTPVGRQVLAAARRTLAHADQVRAAAGGVSERADGPLAFGVAPGIGARAFARLLARFREAHPTVEVMLQEGTGPEIRAWLADETVGAGVMVPDRPNPLIDLVELLRDELVVLVPEGHRLAANTTVHAREIGREPLALWTEEPDDLVLGTLRRSTPPVRPHVAYRSSDLGTVLGLVAEKLAVAVLWRGRIVDAPGGTHAVPLLPARERRVCVAALHSDAPPAAKALMKVARELARPASPRT